jgi:hypothetical protein
MPALSAKNIIKAVGCENVKELVKNAGDGYWYFIYAGDGKFETHSIYTMYLNDMHFERWVEEGKDFVAKIENNS